jgi:hypothetical protein
MVFTSKWQSNKAASFQQTQWQSRKPNAFLCGYNVVRLESWAIDAMDQAVRWRATCVESIIDGKNASQIGDKEK